jgi:hypothetical protein
MSKDNRFIIGADLFGYKGSDGSMLIYKQSDWWWNKAGDGLIGRFVPVPPTESDTVIESNSGEGQEVSPEVKDVSIGSVIVGIQDNITTYWKRIF